MDKRLGSSFAGLALLAGSWGLAPAPAMAAELVAPDRVDFGMVAPGTVVDRTLTFTNAGSVAVPISSVALESAAAGFTIITDGATGTSIPPGGSAAVVVRYAPTTAPSGAPAPEWRMYTNLSATYHYTEGVVTGATVHTGFENLGGSGSLAWRMSGCAPNTSECVPTFDKSGSIPVLRGARYDARGEVACFPAPAGSPGWHPWPRPRPWPAVRRTTCARSSTPGWPTAT